MHWKPVQICALLKCICGIAWLRHFPKSDSKKKTWRVFLKNPAIFCMLWIGSFIIGLRVISLFRFGDRYERNPVQNCARSKCVYGIAWLRHFPKSDSKKKLGECCSRPQLSFACIAFARSALGLPWSKISFDAWFHAINAHLYALKACSDLRTLEVHLRHRLT